MPTATSITVTVPLPLPAGERTVATAVVRDETSAVMPGVRVEWSSTNTTVARINAVTGVITAQSLGTTTIAARIGGVVGSLSVTVTAAAVLTPPTPILDFDPTTIRLGLSGEPLVLDFDTTTLYLGMQGSGSPTLVPTSMTLSLSSSSRPAGQTATATGIVRDQNGDPMVDRAPSYASSNPAVATVHATSGAIMAVSIGTATITASYQVPGGALLTDTEPFTVVAAGARPTGRFNTTNFPGLDRFDMEAAALTVPYPVPTIVVDSTPPDTTGWTVLSVTAASQWASTVAAAVAANADRVIELEPGVVVTSALTVAAGVPADYTGRIVVRTRDTAENGVTFPAHGTRVLKAFGLLHFGGFSSPAATNELGLDVVANTKNVWFQNIKIVQHAAQPSHYGLAWVRKESHNIHFSRVVCVPSDDESNSAIRGFIWAGDLGSVTDSYIGDFRSGGSDAQAIALFGNRYAFKCVNNTMIGSGECILTGEAAEMAGSGAGLTYYPKNMEYRMCHNTHPMRWNPRHTAYRDGPATLRTVTVGSVSGSTIIPMTNGGSVPAGPSKLGAHYGLGDVTVTLSAGAFVTTEAFGLDDSDGITQAYRYYAVCTSGPGVGGWAELQSYGSTTNAVLSTAQVGYWPDGVGPGAGSVLEVRRRAKIRTKNLFEFKAMFNSYVADCIFENHWAGEDTQLYALGNKCSSAEGTGPLALTVDTNIVDCAIVGVCRGFSQAPWQTNHIYDVDAKLYIARNHHDNLLVVLTQSPWAGNQMTYIGGDYFSATRISVFGANAAAVQFADAGPTHGLVLQRVVTDAGGDYPVQSPALPAYNRHYNSTTTTAPRLVQDVGISVNQVPNAAYHAPSNWPQQGNDPANAATPHKTLITTAPIPLPVTSGDWTVADWSTPIPAFQNVALTDGSGTADLGIDWPDLQARISGVRTPGVPFEWERA